MQLSVIIPTYREAENLGILLPRLVECLSNKQISAEIIVVDDDSRDGTQKLCALLQNDDVPVQLITRINERGLSSAVICGMQAAKGHVFLCMDADLSHPVDAVPELYRSLTRSDSPADFVIGSRYTKGGSTAQDWGLARWLNSKVATWLALPLTRVNDPMAGFFAIRRTDFDVAMQTGLSPIGYKIGLELLVKSGVQVIEEVPIHFEDRLHGESKLTFREQLNYVRHLARLYRHRFPGLMKFASFSAVGSTGVAVDLSVLAFGLSLGVSPSVAMVLAIWIAMSWNFALNRSWTFADAPTIKQKDANGAETTALNGQPSVGLVDQYIRFCASCLTGAVVNWSVRVSLLASAVAFADRPFLASIAGILCGLAFNFTICSRFVFSKRVKPNDGPDTLPAAETTELAPVSIIALESETTTRQESIATKQKSRPATIFRVALFFSVLLGASLTSAFLDLPTKTVKPPKPDPKVGKIEKSSTLEPSNKDKTSKQDSSTGLSSTLDVSNAAVSKRLLRDCTYLASDDLEGRGVRTSGLDLAAEFIALHYEKADLDTSHYKNSPYQYFRLYSQGAEGAVQSLRFINGEDETKLELQEDYTSIVAAKTGRFDVEIVFAGFGITAPEIKYDDYANVDVKGKCVIILRHAPSAFTKSESKELQEYSYIRTKIRNAKRHGASSIIFCSDLQEIRRIQAIAKSEQINEPLLKVELTSERENDGLPTVHCHRSKINELFAKANFDLDKVEAQISSSNQPGSQEFPGLRVQGSVAKVRVGQKLKNVVGLLPGRGPLADEAIVLGAHYDHLGRGGWGSLSLGANQAIHNGADDNASGTAVLLEVARQLSARKTPFKRSVLFIAFSGEELGLLGSKRYVRDPIVPIADTIAMLNLDMVGRLRKQQLTVYGTGTSRGWPTMLDAHSTANKIEVIPRRGGYGPSDHASFYERGVPVLHFFTGFHPQYHRPSDDISLLNIDGMRQVTSMVVGMIEQLANAKERPKRAVAADNVEQGTGVTINQLLTNGNTPRNTTRNALLGIVPVEEAGVVKIEQVVKGSGAALAGIRIGDEIVKLGETKIKSQRQLVEVVRSQKPGTKVTIQIRRNGILLELDVTL